MTSMTQCAHRVVNGAIYIIVSTIWTAGCCVSVVPSQQLPFTEPVKLDTPVTVPQSAMLSPGAKPVTVLVTYASAETVIKSTVSWGYLDAAGKYKLGGTKDFDHAGGVLHGEIPHDYFPDEIEVRSVVDYAQPHSSDVEYLIHPKVSTSGAVAVISTASGIIKINFLFTCKAPIHSGDFLSLSYQYTSTDSAQPPLQHSGEIWFCTKDLTISRSSYIARRLELPLRNTHDGDVAWKLAGRIAGKSVKLEGTTKPWEPYVYLIAQEDSKLSSEPAP